MNWLERYYKNKEKLIDANINKNLSRPEILGRVKRLEDSSKHN
mgnify:CR=1 FL=1